MDWATIALQGLRLGIVWGCAEIMYLLGVRQGRKHVPPITDFELGDHGAKSVLQAVPGLDAVALITCEIMSRKPSENGSLGSETMTVTPCYATRSGQTEPCLLEVARALRFLADRIDERVAKAGIVGIHHDPWVDVKSTPEKGPLN